MKIDKFPESADVVSVPSVPLMLKVQVPSILSALVVSVVAN